eukprot:8168708-Pyramimonas_sp.AAC.1
MQIPSTSQAKPGPNHAKSPNQASSEGVSGGAYCQARPNQKSNQAMCDDVLGETPQISVSYTHLTLPTILLV